MSGAFVIGGITSPEDLQNKLIEYTSYELIYWDIQNGCKLYPMKKAKQLTKFETAILMVLL